MDKLAFIDIGELGWSLYLSAHIRWLKKNTDSMVAVICFSDRKCLYADFSDVFIDVPALFYEKYDINMQDAFRLRNLGWDETRNFFSPYVPDAYRIIIPGEYPKHIIKDNRIFKPYRYSKPSEDGREIMVFPRCRSGIWIKRNLPEEFYSRLIKNLCDEFPELTIRTIGTKNGAYDIEIKRHNYINWVGKGKDLQDLIDRCQVAVCAIGGTSAPPKISLLQGVPTFIIGHEKLRFTGHENWMHTRIDFYQIDKRTYRTFNDSACIEAIIGFVRKVQ